MLFRSVQAGDELSLNTPHERALAQVLGWQAADGLLPVAARAARLDGLTVEPGSGWGLLSPAHWHVGTEQVSLTAPEDLSLSDDEAQAFFDALRPLFEELGWSLQWGAPLRWYLRHESLAELPSASLDRVVGRNVDLWLNMAPQARAFRRLQAEVQMLLHAHPLNDSRQEQGLPAMNSVWLSGTGAAQADRATPPTVDDRLRLPALRGDWTAWCEAWQALDAGPLAEAAHRAERGEAVQVWLCGERGSLLLDSRAPQRRPWWRRWWPAAAPVAEQWMAPL